MRCSFISSTVAIEMMLLQCFLLIFAFALRGCFSTIIGGGEKALFAPNVTSQTPQIMFSTVKIYRTNTRHLRVTGSNFPNPDGKQELSLTFEPELKQSVDYTIRVANENELDLTLLNNRAWRAAPGQLFIKSIILSELGVSISFPTPGDGVPVAEVIDDPPLADLNRDESGRLHTSDVRVYQSALQQSISITGSDFGSDLALVLDPPLELNVDYSLHVTSPTAATLKLLPGRKWRASAGPLVVRSVSTAGTTMTLGAHGVRIAFVLEDPMVYFVTTAVNNMQLRDFKIAGAGFTTIDDVKLTLLPSGACTLRVRSVLTSHTMFIEIDSLAMDAESLRIVSIDTGAGAVPVPFPVPVPVHENVVSLVLDDTDDDDTMDASVPTVPQRALRSITELSGDVPVLTLGKSACGVWLLLAAVCVAALAMLTRRKFSDKRTQGYDDDVECFVV